jgi:hypothetical protein
MTRFFAHINASGPVRYRQFPDSIGVLEAPDQTMPIGIAHCVGRNPASQVVWRLRVC